MLIATTLCLLGAPTHGAPPVDTLRLDVGSRVIDGRIYRPHAARVRVYVGPSDSAVAEWTNELSLGDSAGRPVMRWVTRGTRRAATGVITTWEIFQTYDHESMAPYGYLSRSSNGAVTQLVFEGNRVRGTRKQPSDSAPRPYDLILDRRGFIASASDLVPAAAGMREGAVMIAPVWGPNMSASELRVFTVVGKTPITVEGRPWTPWKVEERRYADRQLLATWYLLEDSPYMIYGEVPLPDGRVQRMTEVEIPATAR